MSNFVSNVAGAAAALIIFATLVHCFSSGPANTSFTHPYTGAQGSNENDTTGTTPIDGNTTSGSNTDLLAGATAGAGSATFSGTIRGVAFTPSVAVFDAYGLSPNATQNLVIYLSNDANFCTNLVTHGNLMAGTSYAAIAALAIDANMATATTAPGNYTIVTSDSLASQQTAGNYVSFDFYALDNLCLQSLADSYYQARSGSLALASLSADPTNTPGAAGEMTLIVGAQGDDVSLSFQAAPCPGLYGVVSNANASFGCQ